VDWTRARGWGAPRITPLRPFSLHPAAQARIAAAGLGRGSPAIRLTRGAIAFRAFQTLQYGAHCFEGMKAYAGPDGAPRLFRPELNMARLLSSATRLALPPFCPRQALACIAALVRADAAWLPPPAAAGFALYIRPALAATTPFLGVGPPLDATFFAVLSPCGPYLTPGKAGAAAAADGVTLFLDEALVRAAPGGVGAYKVGGNYAPTIAPAVAAAARHGAAQVLFTAPDAAGGAHRTVAEAGAMNLFFLLRAKHGACELVTPPLDGTILPGVTRRSVLELARAGGIGYAGEAALEVSERPLRVAELADAAREGRLLEMFATGTAAVIMPVQTLIREASEPLRVAGPPAGQAALSAAFASRLADIQYGRTPHPWSVPI
jgi:branched-chain amino acid aminotransferase group II